MNGVLSTIIVLAATQLSWQVARAEPLTTEAEAGELAMLNMLNLRALGGDDLSFCFGSRSICATSNDLYDDCDGLQDNYKDLSPWYRCVCTNGYVSVNEACYWCQLAYDLGPSYNGPMLTKGCQTASATIAPIPSSVLSVQSHYNATYTGVISGGGGAAATGSITGSAVGSVTVTTTMDDSGLTAATGSVSNTAAGTWFGGTTGVETFGGSSPQTTKATTTSSAKSTASGTSAGTNTASRAGSNALLGLSLLFLGLDW